MKAVTGWIVEGMRTYGPHRGKPIRCVIESDEPLTPDQAFWFGAGQLRGMGFAVKDLRVERT